MFTPRNKKKIKTLCVVKVYIWLKFKVGPPIFNSTNEMVQVSTLGVQRQTRKCYDVNLISTEDYCGCTTLTPCVLASRQ